MQQKSLEKDYDDIVIGAGSTGAIIAARLSENPDRRVLLVEAGPDFGGHDNLPEPLKKPHQPVLAGYNWNIRAYLQEQDLLLSQRQPGGNALISRFDYPVGKVVGGSSAINGAIALRGNRADYAQWEALGLPLWSWETILKGFKRVEHDHRHHGKFYSQQGPLPIESIGEGDLYPLQRDFLATCEAMGYSLTDSNDPQAHGLSLVAKNSAQGQRVSTATAYLDPVRGRRNLTIMANTQVDRLLIQQGRARGIVAMNQGRQQQLLARRVILSAGAIHSPGILMRSGIGDKQQLQQHGICPLVDLPGVGQNFIDHAVVPLWAVPKADYVQMGEDIHQVLLRYRSRVQPSLPNDMSLFMLSSVDTSLFPELQTALATPLALAVSAMLGKPQSRGAVTLASACSSDAPNLVLNCAQHPSDKQKLMEGVRLSWYILQQPQLRNKYEKIFACNQRIIDDDQLLAETISTFVRGSWHGVGTAKMGQDSDNMAVVDQYGRVFGVEQLVVADASIMPTIPSVPTNLSCMMVAEVLAEVLR